ncbi:MAG: hypothetical protein FWE71_02740 [Nocardioidaceae bacterium]|nr:hypothetical protein [Nocardioidaceae bacterium]MCL2613774.1 hypothetical protein [Nocardioidaceae bacterium]
MSRKPKKGKKGKKAKKGAAGAPGNRLPRTAPKPWIDARLLLVAAVMSSPAAYRASEGLLPASTALDRFGVITVGCIGLSVLVRVFGPMMIGGEQPPSRTVAGVTMPTAAADALDPKLMDDAYAATELDEFGLPRAGGGGLDLLEDPVDPTDLLELGPSQP